MPIFEVQCAPCGQVEDVYLPRWDESDPPCPACGGPRERLASRFAVPFSGAMHRYMDVKKEGSEMDGFFAYRKRSSISGQPEQVWIGDMQTLKAFNKAEGLSAPGEVPPNATISADGKTIRSDGMPGNWRGCLPEVPSAVARMTKSRTSLSGNVPAPQASGPPCSVTAVDAGMMAKFAAEASG